MSIAPPPPAQETPRSLQGWEPDGQAPLEDFLAELHAMEQLPVDITLSFRGRPDSELSIRSILELEELPGEGVSQWRFWQVIAGEVQIVLAEGEFARARVCPGHVEAAFRGFKIAVGRVELRSYRGGR